MSTSEENGLAFERDSFVIVQFDMIDPKAKRNVPVNANCIDMKKGFASIHCDSSLRILCRDKVPQEIANVVNMRASLYHLH